MFTSITNYVEGNSNYLLVSQISGLKPKEYRALEDRISQLLKSKDGGKVNVNIRDILSSDASSPG